MITVFHILSPAVMLLFLIAAVVLWRRTKSVLAIVLFVSGLVAFVTDLVTQYLLSSEQYGFEPDSIKHFILQINGWVHVGAFVFYGAVLIRVFWSAPQQVSKQAEQIGEVNR